MSDASDPFVKTYQRQGQTLTETWARGAEGRRDKVKADYATYVLINKARLLRARLKQAGSARNQILGETFLGA